MTVNEMIKKLEELQSQGYGDLNISVLISCKNYAPGVRGSGIASVSTGDIGGWGNDAVYIETYEKLKSAYEKD